MLSYRGIVVILFSLEQGPIRPLASTCSHSETSELCVALSSSLPHFLTPPVPPISTSPAPALLVPLSLYPLPPLAL